MVGSKLIVQARVSLTAYLKNFIGAARWNFQYLVKTENNKTLCPILGLPTCDKINLNKRINELEIDTKNNWIRKNIDVFDGLGQFPKLYNLEVVDNFQPKIVPYRRVPTNSSQRQI